MSNALAFYAGKSVAGSGNRSFQRGTNTAECPPCPFCDDTSQTGDLAGVSDAQKQLRMEKKFGAGELDMILDLANLIA